MIDNIEYLRKFIGEDWIKKEIKKIEDKSMLKEVGGRYFNYHPFVQFHYEIMYLLRKANALNQEDILMGKFWEKINKTGYLVQSQLGKIIDKNELKSRLRDANLFDDTSFELEVAEILKKNNIEYNFKKPTTGDSNDITCYIDNRPLEIECKNKHILDEKFNKNNTFSHILCNALSGITVLKGNVIEIEFENGNYEDIKTIINEIKINLKENNTIKVLDKYKISIKNNYIKKAVDEILDIDKVQNYYIIGEQKKKDLYNLSTHQNNLLGVVCKFPNENRNLKNLSSLLKKANNQLLNGGVVFLKIPFHDFDSITIELERILKNSFSNIYCIKAISLKEDFTEDLGVKVSRKEKLIYGDLKKCKLTKKEYDFLNSNIIFSIYK